MKADTVITQTIKITPAQLEKLKKGEPIVICDGSNVMGDRLGIEIRPPGSPRRKPAQEKLDGWVREQRRKRA